MCVRKTFSHVRSSCTSSCPNFNKCQIRLAAMEAALSGTDDQPSLQVNNPNPVVSTYRQRPNLSLVVAV